ncbi:DUF490 domain-containing protein [Azorhizobium oxalatiphilum]|uniref:DUF490 domain-containing protein n=1 Tax=Azorhizobium oxalatiphilum TaxID=980631 RepID=A0A917F3B1_9HYPH|nr:translocation/assembly module TamB domain-containing protein [Azorhizobium oxalatiphilum]GGF48772.1 DUF490 domain-containing protein [Azorhizobium oxalatiphilum]
MRALGLFVRALFGAVLVLLVVGLLVFGFIQTPPGKAFLAELGSKLASGNGLTVRIHGINGAVPWDMSVAEIEASDTQGPFARVENLHLAWSPTSLLSGIARIRDVSATRVDMLRQPALPPAPADAKGGGGPPAIRLVLDRLSIPDIRIAEPVAGQAATLSLEGSATLMEPERGISLQFQLARKDNPGQIGGTARYVPAERVLDLNLQAHEPAGGLVARLARLEGLPPIDAELRGLGPLDNWEGSLKVNAGKAISVSAASWVKAEAGGHRVNFSLDGDVANVVPANLAPLVAGTTNLTGEALVSPNFIVAINRINLKARAGTAEVRGTVDPKPGTLALNFQAAVPDAAPFKALAPGVGFGAVFAKGDLTGTLSAPRLAATVWGEGIAASGYGVGTTTITLSATPDAAGNQALKVDGQLEGLTAQDPRVAATLGRNGSFTVTGALPKGGAPTVTEARVMLAPLDLTFSGSASPAHVAGNLAMPRLDLAALSPLVGQTLAGTLVINGQVMTPDGGGFNAEVTGEATGFKTSDPVINGVVGDAARLTGGLTLGKDGGLAVHDLKLGAGGVDLLVTGRIDPSVANLTARFSLADLARLDKRVSGRVEGKAKFSGNLDALDVKGHVSLPQGSAMNRPVRDLEIKFTGSDLTRLPGGTLNATGTIGGKALNGAAQFASAADGGRSLDGLDIALGTARASGKVALAPNGLMTGGIGIAAPNLADLSALALAEMGGAMTANVTLDAPGGRQRIALKADANKLTAPGVKLERGNFDLAVLDPAVAPALTGKINLGGLDSNGVQVERLAIDATPAGTNATALKLDGLVRGTTLATTGRLNTAPGSYAMRFDTLRLANGSTVATLAQPATVTYADNGVTIDRFALNAGGGSAVIEGKAGETLDLSVDARNLPLAIANLATPSQGLSGTLTAKADLSGPAAAPTGRYTLTLARVSQPELQQNGVGPLDIKADGAFEGGRVTIRSTVSASSLSGVTITGSAPLGEGALDLAIRGQVNLGIANAVLAASGARAAGIANVDATVRGTTTSPSAGGTVRISGGRYDDALNGVTLQNIEATLTGNDRSVTLSSLSARTPNGGSLSGRGQVSLDPADGFPGQADLTLQNAGLVNSELMRLVVDGRLAVTGALATRPQVSGRIDVRNLDINVPDRLTSAGAQIDVRHVNVQRGTAPSQPRATQARGATKPAAARNQQASRAQQRAARAASPFAAGLDLTIAATNRVFVRGMGIDAELGGNLVLTGTSAEPIANGGFQLLRGRFDILGRRLDFSRGVVTFRGSLDPELDFLAESSAADVTARVAVTGPASDPEITFSSTPTLPQDEVVARLLFGKATGQLSTGQALQLAQAVAQFSGGGSQLDSLRRQFGLDSLDFGANSEGTGGEVGIGRRINDNVTLGVRQGTTGGSRVTIDVDVTKNIRLQGGAGSDGGGEVGIGAQWDY